MILVYNYDKACKILDLIFQNQVIMLKIYLDSSLDKDNPKYIMDYKTYEDYPEEERINIRSEFNEKNLQLVSQVIKNLNEFVSMMETDNVNFFELSFNIIEKEFTCSKSYKKSLEEIEESNIDESYHKFINEFEKFVTRNGIHKMNVPELYNKTSGGNGKRSTKYVPINFGQLICKLKDVIIDNGNSDKN